MELTADERPRGAVPRAVALRCLEAAALVDAGGVAELPAEAVLIAEAVHPLIALVGQLEQLGERRSERYRITLAWDSLSHVLGAVACGVGGICGR